MARYNFPAFNNASTPRYIVVWDIHWRVIASHRLEPATDLSGAMAEAIDRFEADGWQAEATPEYALRHVAAILLAFQIALSVVLCLSNVSDER
jgi:hypothetical protein